MRKVTVELDRAYPYFLCALIRVWIKQPIKPRLTKLSIDMIGCMQKVAAPWRKGLAGYQGVNTSHDFVYVQTRLSVYFEHARNEIEYIIAVWVLRRNLKCTFKNVTLTFILKTDSQEKHLVQTASEGPNIDPAVTRYESQLLGLLQRYTRMT